MATRLSKIVTEVSAPGRVPPHNLEAEESVLGACLLSRSAIATALETVVAEDFYKPAHTEMFAIMLDLYARGEPIDAVTMGEELRRQGRLEEYGGKPYLFTLVNAVPSPGSVGHYARIVSENATLRRLIEASQSISDIAYALPDDVEEAVDQAEDLVYQVTNRRVSEDLAHLKDLLTENMEMVEKLYERGSAITGVATGFTDLDDLTAGLQPSNLVIVAARPSMGKSSLALSIAQHVATAEHLPVVIFSLEMSKMELVQRLMCAEARVDSNRLRKGALQDTDWPKLSLALGRLAEAPIFIDDTPNATIMEMRAKCRRIASKQGLGLVIIDYLQLMAPLKRTDNRVQEVSEISRSLKILARELDVPVMALSQLSRNVEYRADKRPLLADLRESGCVTADTRILRADTGAEVTIGELLRTGERPMVWSLDDRMRLEARLVENVFPSGVKEVFRVRLASGRTVHASDNHPFLTVDGWVPLRELLVGSRVGVPRMVPEPLCPRRMPDAEVILLAHLIGDGSFVRRQPIRYATTDEANVAAVTEAAKHFGVTAVRDDYAAARCVTLRLPAPYRLARGRRNPIAEWLDGLGLFGLRSYEKFVPPAVFALPNDQVALFLRHLWATDGCIWWDKTADMARVYYASSSRRLIEDVAQLLLRFGILSRTKPTHKTGYRACWQLTVTGAKNQLVFLDRVGVYGSRGSNVQALVSQLSSKASNTNLDTIPWEVWSRIDVPRLCAAMGSNFKPTTMRKHAPSRQTPTTFAGVLHDSDLELLAKTDVFWDAIAEVESIDNQPVFDATISANHNFIGDGISLHNSIEQDADVVMFIYRDEVYHPDSPQRGIAEIHISKHRSGPIGKVELTFLEHYTKFANLARGM